MSTKTKTSNFNIDTFTVTDLKENTRTPSQKIAFVNISGGPAKIETETVDLFTYGIPRKDDVYYTDDSKRGALKLPLRPDSLLYKVLKSIDDKFGSQEQKEHLFKKNASKYRYIPLLRKPVEKDESDDESDDDSKKKKKNVKPQQERPEYCKIKFDVDYKTGKFLTVLREKIGSSSVLVDKDTLNTIDDVCKYINWNSKLKFNIHISKFYSEIQSKSPDVPRSYGFTMKAKHIEVTPSKLQSKDDDEDYEFDNELSEMVEKETHVIQRQHHNHKHDEEDSDDDKIKEDQDDEHKKQAGKSKLVNDDDLDKDVEPHKKVEHEKVEHEKVEHEKPKKGGKGKAK